MRLLPFNRYWPCLQPIVPSIKDLAIFQSPKATKNAASLFTGAAGLRVIAFFHGNLLFEYGMPPRSKGKPKVDKKGSLLYTDN